MELICDDILSKKCHINLCPIPSIYRVTFVFGFFLNFSFNVDYKLQHLNAFIVKNKLISVDMFVCISVLQRLQHIFKNAFLRFDTLVRTFVNHARCSTLDYTADTSRAYVSEGHAQFTIVRFQIRT
jgi:hypothetical protein